MLYLKSYRQQNIAMLIISALLCLLIWQLNIKNTYKQYQAFQANSAKIETAKTAPQQIIILRGELRQLQKTTLKNYDREELLETITDFCRTEQLLVRSFPQEEIKEKGTFKLISNKITVEGDYKNIVKLAYELENKERITGISSLSFYIYKDRTSRKEVLRADMVLQNTAKI